MAVRSTRRRKRIIVLLLGTTVFLALLGGSVYLVKRGLRKSNLYAEAVAQHAKGDRVGAEKKLREVLSTNPADLAARSLLIQIFCEGKRFEEAESLANELTQQRHSAESGWKELSRIAFRKLDFPAALRFARNVADQDPSFPQATSLQINDALGSPQHRARALQAAINLVTLTDSALAKSSLLLFGAETVLDLSLLQANAERRAGMLRAARDYLGEATRILQASPEWSRDNERSRLLLARIELLGEPGEPRKLAEDHILAALERNQGDMELHAALAGAYTRQGNRLEEVKRQVRALEGNGAFFFWLRCVRRLLDVGEQQAALELLEKPPVPNNSLLNLLRAQALLAGSEEQRTAGIALILGAAQEPTAAPEFTLEAGRLLASAGAWDEVSKLAERLAGTPGNVRLRAELARAMLASGTNVARSLEVVSALAASTQSLPESLQALAILQDGAGAEAVHRFIDATVARFGAQDPTLRLRRAVINALLAQQEKDEGLSRKLRESGIEDLRSVLALPEASKQLLMSGGTLALAAKQPRVAGEFFARAVSLPGDPQDAVVLIRDLTSTLKDAASRTEFSAGVRQGARPEGKVLCEIIADVVEAPSLPQKDLLSRLQGAAAVPETRVSALLWTLAEAGEARDQSTWAGAVEALFRDYPSLRIARQYRGLALIRAESWQAVLDLHAGADLSVSEHAQRLAALRGLNRQAETVEEARAYVRRNPQEPRGFELLAQLHLRNGDKKAALGVLSAAPVVTHAIALERAALIGQLGQLALAEKMYMGLIQAEQGVDLAAWEGLATVLFTANRETELVARTSEVLARESARLTPPIRAKLLVLRGMARERLNDLELALSDYEEAIRIGSEDAVPFNNAAWLRAQLHREEFAPAWAHAERALALAPDVPAVRHTAALVLKIGGKLDEALSQIDAAIDIQNRPENLARAAPKPGHLVDRAEILIGLGKLDDAKKQLEEVIRLFPGTPASERATALSVQLKTSR